MRRWVALLRAVNVGGTGKIAMGDLRGVATSLGWCDTATILQSGSLVFSANGEASALERNLEAALSGTLGLASKIMVRSAAQWQVYVAENPFAEMARSDPSHLLLLALERPAVSVDLAGLPLDEERIIVSGDAAYVTYPGGIGRSRLTTAVLERRLGRRVTGRNWNTVAKVAALLGV